MEDRDDDRMQHVGLVAGRVLLRIALRLAQEEKRDARVGARLADEGQPRRNIGSGSDETASCPGRMKMRRGDQPTLRLVSGPKTRA